MQLAYGSIANGQASDYEEPAQPTNRKGRYSLCPHPHPLLFPPPPFSPKQSQLGDSDILLAQDGASRLLCTQQSSARAFSTQNYKL